MASKTAIVLLAEGAEEMEAVITIDTLGGRSYCNSGRVDWCCSCMLQQRCCDPARCFP
ncbi:hypothetical protein Hamer_G002806 [Homarus americanus]|uniref:Uncharacterized protein n=1 Tax=Homarus americanus TaxID=6706 RepID=A0A8J5MTE0_HOMAM|nr:hypothetical protein Hamer_G002806 [Homarus americanus]